MGEAKRLRLEVTPRLLERFWSRVECRKEGECWPWSAGLTLNGYGKIRIDGRHLRAHRVSYALAHGECPEELILHSCDRRSCVNPRHLRAGTARDNAQDSIERGRKPRPEGRRKLHPSQVRTIQGLLFAGAVHREIASVYGVVRATISQIANGRNWNHLNESETTHD